MPAKVVFRREARAEFNAAVRSYAAEATDLGQRFKAEVLAKIAVIQASPSRFGLSYGDARRIRLDVFPYVIYYRIVRAGVRILSVFHTRRDPAVWRARADEESGKE